MQTARRAFLWSFAAMRDVRADRNLLLGILALQMDFLTRDALITAMHSWVSDKYKTLGEILLSQGAIDRTALTVLEPLIDLHIARHAGEPEQSLAALSTVGSLVGDLHAIADPDIEASVRSLPSTHNEETTLTNSAPPPSSGIRYRKLRDHAVGGLGVVYVAHDNELNREVALKEIKAVFADDTASRTRFVVEAEVTGGLEHPGIVPVYGLGKYDDGRPYYAMRFIKGDSLKDVIEHFHKLETPGRDPGERALALQQLLRRFLDVCDAIEYAHSRGILHRDLKPHNVMVGKYGETLVVDWGLAKSVDRSGSEVPIPEVTLRPSSASGSAETLPGSVFGTPAYMSPEQAAGRIDLLGPASDVYSLGATLYVVLTGKAPFESRNVKLTLDHVKRGIFPKPREVVHWLDPALEAVCLNAMALEPDERYRSPRALANDIERWIADEPVSVRREPYHERVRRWARRYRTAVTVAAVMVLAGLFGLGVVTAVQAQYNGRLKKANAVTTRALGEAREAGKAAQEALAQSEESRKQAEAVRQFLIATFRTRDPSLDSDRTKVVDMLDRAAEKLDKEFTGTATMRGALLNALGETYEGLSLYDKAAATFARADALAEASLGPYHRDTLASRNNLAEAYRAAGRTTEAIRMHEETLKLCTLKLGPGHPTTLATRHNLAEAYRAAGRTTKAIQMHEETLERCTSKLGPDHPTTLAACNSLAAAYESLGRWAEAEPLRRDILASHRKSDRFEIIVLAGDMDRLGSTLVGQAKWPEAESVLRECLTIRAKFVPDDWSRFCAMSLLGGVLLDQKKYAEAEPLVVSGYEGMKAREDKIPAFSKPYLALAAERVLRLYEAWSKPEQAAAWKIKLGLADLPADVFARP
jgi:eukaryotic-like serine/threonine-protein kinase